MNKNILEMSKSFFKYYDKTLDVILAAFFCFMTSIVFIEIIGRYFFNFTMMFSEELARYMFVWIIWLGAARAFTLKRHLLVDFLINKIRRHLRIYIEIFLYVLIMIFLFYTFLNGIKYSNIYWDSLFYSTQFLKLGWAYGIIPIASLVMILNILRVIIEILYEKSRTEEGINN